MIHEVDKGGDGLLERYVGRGGKRLSSVIDEVVV